MSVNEKHCDDYKDILNNPSAIVNNKLAILCLPDVPQFPLDSNRICIARLSTRALKQGDL